MKILIYLTGLIIVIYGVYLSFAGLDVVNWWAGFIIGLGYSLGSYAGKKG